MWLCVVNKVTSNIDIQHSAPLGTSKKIGVNLSVTGAYRWSDAYNYRSVVRLEVRAVGATMGETAGTERRDRVDRRGVGVNQGRKNRCQMRWR